MADIVPTVGRIVLYRLSQVDITSIMNARRNSVLRGNAMEAGDIFPAMVVAVWGETPTSAVNLKVMLDGDDSFWATSRVVGDTPGTYHWMAYQKKTASGEIAPTLHAQAGKIG